MAQSLEAAYKAAKLKQRKAREKARAIVDQQSKTKGKTK